MASERNLHAKEKRRPGLSRTGESVDYPFLLLVLLLLTVGLAMLYSASYAQSEFDTGYTVSTRETTPILTYLQDNLQTAEPLVQQIGCVIGTHAGPGAFGLAFFDQGLTLE